MSAGSQHATVSAELTGRRVEEALDRLAAAAPAARDAAEELVRVLMDFYGAGLARAVGLLGAEPASAAALARLLDDELVTALLVLHDLHPQDVTARIARALTTVPAHPAEVLDYDPEAGTLRLRLAGEGGGGCGCAGTAQGARQAIEAALACFAPEVSSVELAEAETGPALLQIGSRPPGRRPEARTVEAR